MNENICEMDFEGISLRLHLSESDVTRILAASELELPAARIGATRAVSEPFISCDGYRAIALGAAEARPETDGATPSPVRWRIVIEVIDRFVPRRRADLALAHFAQRMSLTMPRSENALAGAV